MSHRNARLNYRGRLLLVQRVCRDGWAIAHAAKAQGVSRQCAGLVVLVSPGGRMKRGIVQELGFSRTSFPQLSERQRTPTDANHAGGVGGPV